MVISGKKEKFDRQLLLSSICHGDSPRQFEGTHLPKASSQSPQKTPVPPHNHNDSVKPFDLSLSPSPPLPPRPPLPPQSRRSQEERESDPPENQKTAPLQPPSYPAHQNSSPRHKAASRPPAAPPRHSTTTKSLSTGEMPLAGFLLRDRALCECSGSGMHCGGFCSAHVGRGCCSRWRGSGRGGCR